VVAGSLTVSPTVPARSPAVGSSHTHSMPTAAWQCRGRLLWTLLAIGPLAVSCDKQASREVVVPDENASVTPDPTFRLDDASREQLAHAFDPDAMEELSALYDPTVRAVALAEFLELAVRAGNERSP
jgi:hypothetical protein